MPENVAEAILTARKCIEINQKVGLHWTTLGEALEASDDLDGAVEAYQKALELDPVEKHAIGHLQRLGKPIRRDSSEKNG